MKAATITPYVAGIVTCISIHAAREGGDVTLPLFIPMPERFQSTPPVKAATWLYAWNQYDYVISIHAAREGGDTNARYGCIIEAYFNPRRP